MQRTLFFFAFIGFGNAEWPFLPPDPIDSIIPRIHLDLTNFGDENEAYGGMQHDCLHVPAITEEYILSYQTVSYCLTEWPSQWIIEANPWDRRLTFVELFQQDVTSEDLSRWSAPIDVAEDYQSYLEQRSTDSSEMHPMDKYVFANCTSIRFGRQCQYSLDDLYQPHHSSLTQIVRAFYAVQYSPTTLTCYVHLHCDRGPRSACLGWHEVCNGIVDCLNDAADEQACWQLRLHECEENEYRCRNGQCIPRVFFHDHPLTSECLDQSDQDHTSPLFQVNLNSNEPTFLEEDSQITEFETVVPLGWGSSPSILHRNALLKKQRFIETPAWLSEPCWSAFKCRFIESCAEHSHPLNECPPLLMIPSTPLLFGHLYFVYDKASILNWTHLSTPHYICSNDRLCHGFPSNGPILSLHNLTCRPPDNILPDLHNTGLNYVIGAIHKQFYHCNTVLYDDPSVCTRSDTYRCLNSSKCISMEQLCDGRIDCSLRDDEQCQLLVDDRCAVGEFHQLFKCHHLRKCISPLLLRDGECDCPSKYFRLCEDEHVGIEWDTDFVAFDTICNGFTQLTPLVIDGRNESDETHCEHWNCINVYTWCDRRWNCLNGADEIQCPFSSCPWGFHRCVSSQTMNFTCLPLSRADDGHIDCLGATDEPRLCRSISDAPTKNFLCKDACISSAELCKADNRCAGGEDEQLCSATQNITGSMSICHYLFLEHQSPIQSFFCARYIDGVFSPSQFQWANPFYPPAPPKKTLAQRCHRGLPLRVWLDSAHDKSTGACLCPPSYYGKMCEMENQRVSLTVQFRAFSDSRRTLFVVMISLIDDQRKISSYEQHTYHYMRDCKMKYNVNLLYPSRPRDLLTNYSVRIDIYEKTSLIHRGSFTHPVNYSFLPIDRIALQLTIPRKNRRITDRRFEQGHSCRCSSDSLCVGVTPRNASVCVCPVGKWGRRCFLRSDPCRSVCLNGGSCLVDDHPWIEQKKFFCLCRRGFSGDRCERVDPSLTLTFAEQIGLPQSLIVYFINTASRNGHVPLISSVVRTVTLFERTIVMHRTTLSHLVIVQLINEYYFVMTRDVSSMWMSHNRTIHPSDRCPSFDEFFNSTIVSLHPLRRMKFYQIPCERFASTLQCFHDRHYFCLCYSFDNRWLSNCFNWKKDQQGICDGLSECENGGQCLEDDPRCPQASICLCPKCFHGRRCQFSSHLFGLSLDAILGYHIRPHVSFHQQSTVVRVTLLFTLIITIAGLINATLSMLTFQSRVLRKTGCGCYLLASAITVALTMLVFVSKVAILFSVQIHYFTDRTFLLIQCSLLDFLLRLGLNVDQYLNACVAGERALMVVKGTAFNAKTSVRTAKFLLGIVLLWMVGTTLVEPIHRRLLEDNHDDEDLEKRIWCIVSYSPNVRWFSSLINSIHFFLPFLVNIFSSAIILLFTTRQRQRLQRRRTYQRIFREQLREHQHLLIAPLVLIALGTPRLILSFIGDCMQPTTHVWLPLLAYFISFIPPTLTMLIFVCPSTLYSNEFKNALNKIRHQFQSYRRRIIISTSSSSF